MKKKVKEDTVSLKCEVILRDSVSILFLQLCKNVVRLNQSGSKWNLYEHVVLNHSTHRPYKCTKCNYSGVRKVFIFHFWNYSSAGKGSSAHHICPRVG